MEQIYKPLLAFHIFCGMVSLVTGFISMSARKGMKIHRKSGVIYFYAMLLTGFTAIPIAYYKENIFLILIAIFSLYLVTTGYRMTRRKKGDHTLIDILIPLAMLMASVYMIWTRNIIVVVFGTVGLVNSLLDLKRIFLPRKEPLKFDWLYGHIGKMAGSYIATVTAFVVNNVTTDYPLLLWFGPLFFGSIFIAYWIRFYSLKEKNNKSVTTL